jgi:hypothetical protein
VHQHKVEHRAVSSPSRTMSHFSEFCWWLNKKPRTEETERRVVDRRPLGSDASFCNASGSVSLRIFGTALRLTLV